MDQGGLFSYISPEARVPANHPLRKIRALVRDVLNELNRSLGRLYASEGRPSIPPEQLLSALLLQVFYGIRSERQLTEQLDYNLLYRWFVGLSPTTRSGSVIERHQRPIGQRPFDAALDRLMMNSHPLCDGKKRWVLAISQKHLSTLHPTRRLSPRPRNGHQPRDLLICHPHLKGLTPCCHHTAPRSALPKRGIHQQHFSCMDAGLIKAGFMESVV